MSISEQILASSPARFAHELRRLRFRLRSPAAFSRLQEYRRTMGGAGLESFDRLRTIFVHIPKCAGTSVSTGIFGHTVGAHHALTFYQLVYPWKNFISYFKFAVVRNPFDRLASAFRYMKNGGGNASDAAWSMDNSHAFQSFESFVTEHLRTPAIVQAMHFMPQVNYLTDIRGKLSVNYVGRFEELHQAFAIICSQLNIVRELTWVNRTIVPSNTAYQALYNMRMRKIVYDVYARDFSTFGYEFKG